MNKISFALKNPKAENTAIILLHTCYDGRLKYYTGEKANPKKWPAVDDATDAQLSKIKNTVRELITDHKYKSQPLTKAIIVSSLDKLLHKKKVVSYDLFEAMTEVVDKMRSGNILTPQKKKYSKGLSKRLFRERYSTSLEGENRFRLLVFLYRLTGLFLPNWGILK